MYPTMYVLLFYVQNWTDMYYLANCMKNCLQKLQKIENSEYYSHTYNPSYYSKEKKIQCHKN